MTNQILIQSAHIIEQSDHVTKRIVLNYLRNGKERGNQNHNPNQNVQNISTKNCNEGPRIAVVKCEGTRKGVDAMNGGKKEEKWVRKSIGPMPTFDP
jgi:hypothetical protein